MDKGRVTIQCIVAANSNAVKWRERNPYAMVIVDEHIAGDLVLFSPSPVLHPVLESVIQKL
jgi:hypothetical protein